MAIVFICSEKPTSAPENNTGLMRSEGKIYVAMVVAITILTGLILFVWRLDKKITTLEKR